MLSFYDWYADLPVASPQVFGDQTDAPESGDWWNASSSAAAQPAADGTASDKHD